MRTRPVMIREEGRRIVMKAGKFNFRDNFRDDSGHEFRDQLLNYNLWIITDKDLIHLLRQQLRS